MPRLNARLRERSSATFPDYIVDAAWSHDGATLAIALGDGSIHIAARDTALGARELGRHSAGALAVAWFADGTLCSSGQDSTLRFWNPSGESTVAPKRARAWSPQLVARPGGGQARGEPAHAGSSVAAAAGRSIDLWSADGSAAFAPGEQSSVVQALAFSPDGSTLIAASIGELSLFRLASGSASTERVPWEGASLCLVVSPNGRYVAAGLRDGVIRFRRLAAQENSQISGYETKVALLAWTANSRYLASAAAEELIVWDFSGRGPEGREPLRLRNHTDHITALAGHPSKPLIASGGKDWRIALCEPGAGAVPLDVQLAPAEPSVMRWSADGSRLAVGQTSGDLTIYELTGG